MSNITAHMVVKNEDQWIYYAIMSTLPFVDEFFITDTGSTDNTLEIIRGINDPKIKLTETKITSPSELTAIRQKQLGETKTPWIWIVDGDEIYTKEAAREVVQASQDNRYSIIVVRRHDCLGDIYHAQSEEVGTYNLYGQKGHLVTRLFNLSQLDGLRVSGDYPNEAYYYANNQPTLQLDPKLVYITKNHLYHTMYLRRSSLGNNILSTLNRSKYKIELGERINDNLPDVFQSPVKYNHNPLQFRSISYLLIASIISPIKNLKRKIFSLWT